MIQLKKGDVFMNLNPVLTDVVEHKGNHYCVDSRYTMDHGYETMIFACDSNGNVTSWSDLYADRYDNAFSMMKAHKKIVANIGSVLMG